MNKGAEKMAVVTYTIGKDGGTGRPTISPDIGPIEFRPGDYIVFNGTDGTIVVRVQMPLTTHFLGCVTSARVSIRAPKLDPEGNVIIEFEKLGGDSGDQGFPVTP
jgi:hypothetical protein